MVFNNESCTRLINDFEFCIKAFGPYQLYTRLSNLSSLSIFMSTLISNYYEWPEYQNDKVIINYCVIIIQPPDFKLFPRTLVIGSKSNKKRIETLLRLATYFIRKHEISETYCSAKSAPTTHTLQDNLAHVAFLE